LSGFRTSKPKNWKETYKPKKNFSETYVFFQPCVIVSFPFAGWRHLSHGGQSNTIIKHDAHGLRTTARPSQQQLSFCLMSASRQPTVIWRLLLTWWNVASDSHRVRKDKRLSLQTELRLFQAVVLSVLLYSAETWTLLASSHRRCCSISSSSSCRCCRSGGGGGVGGSSSSSSTSPNIVCQSLKFLVASICDLPDVINC